MLPPVGPRALNDLDAVAWLRICAEEVFGVKSVTRNQPAIDFLARTSKADVNQIVNELIGEKSNWSIQHMVKVSLKSIERDYLARGFQKRNEASQRNDAESVRMMVSVLVRGPIYLPSKHGLEDAIALIAYMSILKLIQMRRFSQAEEVASLGATYIAAVMLLADNQRI